MKTKRIILLTALAIVTLITVIFAPLASLLTAGMREPIEVLAPDYWPTNGWQSRSPEEGGIDSDALAKGLLDLHEKGSAIDSLLIIRNGYVVLDAHFAPYDGSFPHDLASVTKSVMSTLIAIAAEQGHVDLDRSVVSYFPDRKIANLDERKERITVRHLVGMVDGMEAVCKDGDEINLDAMRSTPDWVQTALDRPMVAEPGTKFCYDSPGFHLLSAILQNATGMTVLEFARQNLFEPLGIHQATWEIDPQGRTRGWGDLHLLPEDAAKIGLLFLHRGEWDGKQVVPEAWVLDAVRAHSRFLEDDYGYGYGWWVSPVDYYASGRGGQNIHVLSSVNMLVVVTAGGFEFSEVQSFLMPALLRMKDSLPENPEGQAALAAALDQIRQDPPASSAVPSSDLIQTISATTYRCASNPFDVETMHLNFTDPAQATLSARMNGIDDNWAIGIDGKYRLSPTGEAYRGHWLDAQTFQYDVFDVGVLAYQLHFDSDRLHVTLPDLETTILCQGPDS